MRVLGTMGAAVGMALAAPTPAETLAGAIADAYRNNPGLQAQRAELRALDEDVIEALSPYRLGATLGTDIAASRRRQRSVSTEGFATFEQQSLDLTLSVTQLISSGGRVAAQVSAAEADVLAGRERLREAENATLFEVIDAYAAVRRDEQLVAIQARSLTSYERQVAQNRSREAAGDLARTDVAQAEAQQLIIRAALAQARASLQQSRSRFAAVVGRNPNLLEPEPPLPGLPATVDIAYAASETESPAILQASLAERASRDRVAAARSERHPTITAQGGFGYTNPLGLEVRDLGLNGSVGLTVSMPILSQGVIGSRVRRAQAVQQSSAFRMEETRRSVAASLLNAWNQSVTAAEQLRVGDDAVRAAEIALGGVKRGFVEGFRSNFEVIDSEQRLLNAQVIVTNAYYARYSGQATLLALLGRLQAVALVDNATPYDAAANLRYQKRQQAGPLTPVVHLLDRALTATDRVARPAPVPPIPNARARAAEQAPPVGDLATALPLGRP